MFKFWFGLINFFFMEVFKEIYYKGNKGSYVIRLG